MDLDMKLLKSDGEMLWNHKLLAKASVFPCGEALNG
jgi:hypothetical protein